MIRARIRLAGLALLLAVAPALAQQAPRPAQQGTPPEAPPPPYEAQLLRLSELMGALAYLRDLCGGGDGEDWRRRMEALLEAEATTQARRERFAGAFNRGFRGFETTYRACTPAAETAIARYLDEGARIARDVSGRYGG